MTVAVAYALDWLLLILALGALVSVLYLLWRDR